MTSWITLYLQGSGRSAMPCKEQRETLRNEFWLYRSCTASFDPKLSREVIRDGGNEAQR
jgi:hypothetical protein